ncbi:class I SAM-dependent DNA methyltransferase [Sorangium sp. So ce307]
MPTKRDLLTHLTRDELLAVVSRFELPVSDRRVRDQLIDAIIQARSADLSEVLLGYPRDRLKELCRKLGLDDHGKEKAPIVERLLGKATAAEAEAQRALPFEKTSPGSKPRATERANGKAAEEANGKVSARPNGKTANGHGGQAAERGGGDLGFERTLFQAADKLRNNMDAAEYKHVVLGLIFLKYISDAFDELHQRLSAQIDEGADPEDRDEYRAERVFWVPKEARWAGIQANAKQAKIGQLIDDAMVAIERDNPSLKGVLPKNYGRPQLDKQRLGELVDLIGTIGFGAKQNRSKDILGRVYEYFLSEFALAEGKKGGQFYTPGSVVRLLVEMLAPYKGRVYDPCCGSGGMFVQSEKFIEEHGGRVGDISVYGQESNPTTWRLAKMNLAIRGIEANLGPENADTFHRDLHKDLKADYILANPPFNAKDWGQERLKDDVRWKYGTPPTGSANFAWVQHFIHHLAPAGQAGFVLANGSMSSNQSDEGEIRKAIIEADLVDCMVALPGQLFYSTQIPVCFWFLARDKKNGRFRDRRGQILFIDARKLGRMIDRTQRELTGTDVARVAGTYHAWRGDKRAGEYEDIAGFCKSATLDDVRAHQHVLTPGRYVGAEDVEDDEEPFEERFPKLLAKLEEQFTESIALERRIRSGLRTIQRA